MKLRPRKQLPQPWDDPRSAFAEGWWSGIAVGIVTMLAIGVIALKVH